MMCFELSKSKLGKEFRMKINMFLVLSNVLFSFNLGDLYTVKR